MGTNWGMFNAVTHYVDHLNEHKEGTDYAAFGNGHLLKAKAFSRYSVEKQSEEIRECYVNPDTFEKGFNTP